MNEKFYNCVKNDTPRHFFNASGLIQQSHFLGTQMNEKFCAPKNLLFLMIAIQSIDSLTKLQRRCNSLNLLRLEALERNAITHYWFQYIN
jgi:hypothetical protein